MYQIQSPAQLGIYLRALRKSKELTQGQLGTMLGVSKARVSEIETDPSKLGFSQLQTILHLLGARLVIDTAEGDARTGERAGTRGAAEW